MELVKQLDSKSGEIVGQLWANKVVGEMMAIARDELLDISRIIDEFRRAEGVPPSRI